MELTAQDKKAILNRVNVYADTVLPERDPSKVPIRVQLDALKPEMEKLAEEFNVSVEDIFIAYMDMNTETVAEADAKVQEQLDYMDFKL
ncbi:MAG: hypothetical protein IJF03_05575 [Lachnospiraceae bacterium]|nr:hypothetical protein [Lachnospiraceae bacterium]